MGVHQVITGAVCGVASVTVRALCVRLSAAMTRARSLEAEPGRVPGSVWDRGGGGWASPTKPHQELQAALGEPCCSLWHLAGLSRWDAEWEFALRRHLSDCQVCHQLWALAALGWADGGSTTIKVRAISCQLLRHAVSFHSWWNEPESGSIISAGPYAPRTGQAALREHSVASLACSNPAHQPFLASGVSFPTLHKQDSSLFMPGRPFQRG